MSYISEIEAIIVARCPTTARVERYLGEFRDTFGGEQLDALRMKVQSGTCILVKFESMHAAGEDNAGELERERVLFQLGICATSRRLIDSSADELWDLLQTIRLAFKPVKVTLTDGYMASMWLESITNVYSEPEMTVFQADITTDLKRYLV